MSAVENAADNPQGWRLLAACRDHDPELFFPYFSGQERPEVAYAKRICASCLVIGDCLQHALDNGESGIWGGTTERERRRMKKKAS